MSGINSMPMKKHDQIKHNYFITQTFKQLVGQFKIENAWILMLQK